MKQTIRIEQVLRETVRTPYSDLVTRPTGRAVRSGIQQAMAAVPAGLALLDFSEVGPALENALTKIVDSAL